jgi:hypothetical protein
LKSGNFQRVSNADEYGQELVDVLTKFKLFGDRFVTLIESQIELLPTTSPQERHIKEMFQSAIDVKNMTIRDRKYVGSQLETDFGIVNKPAILIKSIEDQFQQGYNQEYQHYSVKLAQFVIDTKVNNFMKSMNALSHVLKSVDDNHPSKHRLNEYGRKGWVIYHMKNSNAKRYREIAEDAMRLERETMDKTGKYYFESLSALIKWFADTLNMDNVREKRARPVSPNVKPVGGAAADPKEVKCFKCGLFGHKKDKCKTPEDQYARDKRPKKNGSPGKNKKPGAPNPFKGTCNKCGVAGHMAKFCKKQPDKKDNTESEAGNGNSA